MSEFEDKLQSILGNPEAMSQIMSIAQSITGNSQDSGAAAEEEPAPPPPENQAAGDPFSMLGNLDPRLVQMGMRLLSEYNSTDDRKVALLTALQPFVREERYAKVDKAIQIAKLAHVIRVALDVFR
ncbi:MAG: hypothetical protein ACI4O5_05545, partial [Oscillospiraceae bacterium]